MADKPFPSGHDLTAADVNRLVGILDQSTAEFDLVNTAAGGTMYDKSVAANAMSTDRLLRCTILGDYLNNSGTSQSLTMSVQLGGTLLWGDSTTATITTSAVRRLFRLTFEIANLGSASVQTLSGFWVLSAPVAGSGAGLGAIDSGSVNAPLAGTGAKDTTGALTLAWTAQHGAASTNISLRKKYALLELA